MWHLVKIPRILHVYWGGGPLPYLRYMTVKTFIGLNRDWQVRVYFPQYPQKHMSWTTHEQKYEFKGTDYTGELLRLPIREVRFNFEEIGVSNTLSEVHKSDFLRWYLLSTTGGLWADMDLLFFQPIDNVPFNTKCNAGLDTGVNISRYGHSIGFMFGSKNNLYYRYIWCKTKAALNQENYQSIGSLLSNTLFPRLDNIVRVLPALNVFNIPMDVVYAYDAMHVGEIFCAGDMGRYTDSSIGLHWYAGHVLAGQFLKDTNGGLENVPDSVVGKTLKAITGSTLPAFLNTLIPEGSAVLDLGSGDKKLAGLLHAKVTTVDAWEPFKPDVVWNMNKTPLPFKDKSYDTVLLLDTIEHFKKEKGVEVLKEAKRICKKSVIVLTPLWWTDNLDNMNDENSSYFGNPFEAHQSLWSVEDFQGFKPLTELRLIRNYFFGVWEKR